MSAPLHEQILRGLSSGVIAVDGQGVIQTVNPAACRHLAIDAGALKSGVRMDALPGLDKLREVVEELRAGGEPISRREIVWQDDDGAERAIGLTASPLEGPDPFNGAILLFADLTEVRRLARLADLNRQLAYVGELTAGVVHELRNPLSVISGEAEYIQRWISKDPKLGRHAQAIVDEVRGLELLIRQFLTFAKPFSVDRGPCVPADILARAAALCARQAKEKGVLLEQDFAPEETVYVDQAKLAQALANLAANAIDATPPGGKVTLRAILEARHLLLLSEDEGPGIDVPPEVDVFSPFYSKKESGTGLGLSIVHRIANAHEGAVRYWNRPEGGAVFELRVPRT